MNKIRKKIVHLDEHGRLNLDDIRDLVDLKDAVYYRVKANKDKTITIKFYNKKRKLIKLCGKKD
jgi:predicted RNA-binding protein with RPS1 domain